MYFIDGTKALYTVFIIIIIIIIIIILTLMKFQFPGNPKW